MRGKQIRKKNRLRNQYLSTHSMQEQNTTRLKNLFSVLVLLLNFLERKGEMQMNRFGNWVYQMSNDFFNPEEKLMIEESRRMKTQLDNNLKKIKKKKGILYLLSIKILNKKIQELIITWKSIIEITLSIRVKLIELCHRISIAHF
ncbi:MAG: hypothetical protein HOB26_02630 [Flavobacteriales bacterium]|jgi:hypothetical protein|nr:hypothetical protein [Flavobacteriales bacterium]